MGVLRGRAAPAHSTVARYAAFAISREDAKALWRVRDILENPRVALVVDRWSEDWHDLAHVRVSGTASLLEHGPEWQRAAAALVAKYPQYRALPLAGRPILRIAAERIGSWSGSPTRT